MQLPRYNRVSGISYQDLIEINKFENIHSILDNLFISSDFKQQVFMDYIDSHFFKKDAEYSSNEKDIKLCCNLMCKVFDFAVQSGFPNKLKINSTKFDLQLAILIYEFNEDNNIEYTPSLVSDENLQEFMTQRFLLPITYWRWSKNDGNEISNDRFKSGSRNYFFVLFIIAWLFDKGKNSNNRWEFLSVLSADIIVQIIERPGIGYRKGFAQTLIKKILYCKDLNIDLNYDRVIRGVMKRANFTFSVSSMPDEIEYYEKVVDYLFDWSLNNYVENYNDLQFDDEFSENESEETQDMDSSIINKQSGIDFSKLDENKFLIKKLTSNELGYRKGIVKSGQTIYISKNVVNFFPQLSNDIKNDTIEIDVFFSNKKKNTKLKFVYHNDKKNTPNGSRDEYRIYLNKVIAPDDNYLKPDDLIVFQRLNEYEYNLYLIKLDTKLYDSVNNILNSISPNTNCTLVQEINELKYFKYIY